MRALIVDESLKVNFVQEVRFVKADDSWMSPANGRESCQICALSAKSPSANRYFEGIPAEDPTAKPKPDYKQALLYFQEALKLNPSPKVRHQVDLRIARSHQELGQHPQAMAA